MPWPHSQAMGKLQGCKLSHSITHNMLSQLSWPHNETMMELLGFMHVHYVVWTLRTVPAQNPMGASKCFCLPCIEFYIFVMHSSHHHKIRIKLASKVPDCMSCKMCKRSQLNQSSRSSASCINRVTNRGIPQRSGQLYGCCSIKQEFPTSESHVK